MNKALVIAAGLGLAAYAINKQANAAAQTTSDGTTALDYVNPLGGFETMFNQYQTNQAMQDPQIQAAQETIAQCEGTASQPDPYRVCFGYRHVIADLSDHPAVTGEWKGERLSDAQCKGAGFGPGCVSTAAGKYQITRPTWLEAKRALNLPDFSPDSQDAACAWLIDRQGATGAVSRGDVLSFVKLCAPVWASLPGAGYAGQGQRSIDFVYAAWEGAGGTVA